MLHCILQITRDFSILGDCSHCSLHPDVTDGPCKSFSKRDKYCVNEAETRYCVVTEAKHLCQKRTPGEWVNQFEIKQILRTFFDLPSINYNSTPIKSF